MAVTVTGPPANLVLAGTGVLATRSVGTTDTEVWVTEIGGPRLVRIPLSDAVRVEWTETLAPMPETSAKLTVARYALLDDDPVSWVMSELRVRRDRAPREVQIVHGGRVVFWGPVVTTTPTPGAAATEVACSGCEFWLGFRLVTETDAEVFGVEQIRPAAVFDPPLDLGGTRWEWGRELWFDRSDWRFTAEVRVDADVDADEPILTLAVEGGLEIPGQGETITAGQLSRDTWTTAVISISLVAGGLGSPGQAMTLTVAGEGAAAGEVLVREVTAQVSPVSVGLDEMSTPEARFYGARESWLEIMGYVADLGIIGWTETEGELHQTGWKRPDVFAVEAGRQLTEGGTAEAAMALTTGVRVAQLWGRRGVEHDPEDLTLDDDTVIEWGGWSSGLDRPVTEWIVANDEGFTGSFHDTAAFGGLRLQAYSSAPTGTPASALAYWARHYAEEAVATGGEQLAVTVPMHLEATLGVGDRVWVLLDDGPDSWDGLMRVQAKTVRPEAAGFEVALSPWVEPS